MSTELVRGYRGKLEGSIDPSAAFTVRMETEGAAVYDTCCFGVDSSDTLSDDRYMVFYNQTSSPNGEISYTDNGGVSEYKVELARLPQSVAKLVFTVSIDGAGTMGEIRRHSLSVWQNGTERMRLNLGGGDFGAEKAIIDIEIYNKTVWRLAVVANGFNGGLGDLLASYGGESVEEQQAQAQSAPPPAPIPTPTPTPAPAQQQFTQPAQPQFTQPAQPKFTQPAQPKFTQPAQPKTPAASVPDFTPRPFVTVPLPEIPPIPQSAIYNYNTAPLPTSPIAPPPPMGFTTQPLPTGQMVQSEQPFNYNTAPL